MTTVTAPRPGADTAAGAVRRGTLGRIVDKAGGGVLQVVLVVLALFWLVPTLGLMVVSLRADADNNSSGWWTALTRPAQLTLENYSNILASGLDCCRAVRPLSARTGPAGLARCRSRNAPGIPRSSRK
jgi:alpha-glucoside transport system permease protein